MSEPQQPTSDPYNYTIFEGKEDFIQFRTTLQVGSPAPDFTATLLETGQSIRLSDYWQDRDLLIEFGSLT